LRIEDRIERLAERGDITRLVKILRQEGDPQPRILAVHALANIDDRQVPEILIAAVLNDPDETVQATARKALRELLGFQAELVLAFASATSAPDPGWLIPAPPQVSEEELSTDEDEWGLTNAEGETLHGLIAIAQNDPKRETRLRAVRALGRVREMSATRVLAELALWDDDKVVSEAAYDAIEATFGRDTDTILEEIRRDVMGDEREAEEVRQTHSSFQQTTASRSPSQWNIPANSSVIKEEGAPIWLLIVVVLAIGGGVWWLFLR
jgi:hypothetical protein